MIGFGTLVLLLALMPTLVTAQGALSPDVSSITAPVQPAAPTAMAPGVPIATPAPQAVPPTSVTAQLGTRTPGIQLPSPLPANFENLDKAEQLRVLQEQLDVYELYNLLAEKRKSIIQNLQVGSAPAIAASPAAVVPAPPPAIASAAPHPATLPPIPSMGEMSLGPAPVVQRIHIVKGERVAEVMFPTMGPRTLHKGSQLPDGRRVEEITADDVIAVDPGSSGKRAPLAAQAPTTAVSAATAATGPHPGHSP